MTRSMFTAPRHPLERWEDLTEHEKAWIEFIRVISNGRNPGITLKRVQALREVLDRGGDVGQPLILVQAALDQE
jgi:hypothetical protein